MTEIFEAALREKHVWTRGSVRGVLAALQNCIPETHVDWEEGEENWARLLRCGNVVALCSALVPVIVVLSKYSDGVQHALSGCHLIMVDSFSDDAFKIERTILEQIVGREMSRNVNYDKLSMDDLWWATV
ncbi:MAG: hypothetical protein ACK5SI_08550 [Planctomycetia bacterium]